MACCQVGCSRSMPNSTLDIILVWRVREFTKFDAVCSMTFGLILQQRGHRHSLCLGTAQRMCRSVVSGQFALVTALPTSSSPAAHSCLSPHQHELSLASTMSWTRGLIQAKPLTLQMINFSYTSSPNCLTTSV